MVQTKFSLLVAWGKFGATRKKIYTPKYRALNNDIPHDAQVLKRHDNAICLPGAVRVNRNFDNCHSGCPKWITRGNSATSKD